jgi:hypothetical protein
MQSINNVSQRTLCEVGLWQRWLADMPPNSEAGMGWLTTTISVHLADVVMHQDSDNNGKTKFSLVLSLKVLS